MENHSPCANFTCNIKASAYAHFRYLTYAPVVTENKHVEKSSVHGAAVGKLMSLVSADDLVCETGIVHNVGIEKIVVLKAESVFLRKLQAFVDIVKLRDYQKPTHLQAPLLFRCFHSLFP